MPETDPAEILRLLPERWHEQFLAEHAAFLHRWRLSAIAFSDPGCDAALREAADPDAELTDITPLLEAHRAWVAAGRPGELSQEEAATLLIETLAAPVVIEWATTIRMDGSGGEWVEHEGRARRAGRPGGEPPAAP